MGPCGDCMERQDRWGSKLTVKNEMTKETLVFFPFFPARSVISSKMISVSVPIIRCYFGGGSKSRERLERQEKCYSFLSESDYSGTIDQLALFVHWFCYWFNVYWTPTVWLRQLGVTDKQIKKTPKAKQVQYVSVLKEFPLLCSLLGTQTRIPMVILNSSLVWLCDGAMEPQGRIC